MVEAVKRKFKIEDKQIHANSKNPEPFNEKSLPYLDILANCAGVIYPGDLGMVFP